jgi:hypothetical protein
LEEKVNIGMLWRDDDKRRSFEEKVQRAADYYMMKYGRWPELCLVNVLMLADERKVGAIAVQPVKNVLPHHFWLGMRQ